MCFESRSTLVSWVMFSAAQSSTRSSKSAKAGAAQSSRGAASAATRKFLQEMPAARCHNPDAEDRIGHRMGQDRRPQVIGCDVEPGIRQPCDQTGEPQGM